MIGQLRVRNVFIAASFNRSALGTLFSHIIKKKEVPLLWEYEYVVTQCWLFSSAGKDRGGGDSVCLYKVM